MKYITQYMKYITHDSYHYINNIVSNFFSIGSCNRIKIPSFFMYPVQDDHFLQFNININSFFTDDTCTQFLTIANIFLYYHKYIKKNSFNFFLQLIHN